LVQVELKGRKLTIVGEPLFPHNLTGIAPAYEDPSVFLLGDRLYVGATWAQKPISALQVRDYFPEEVQSWHLASPIVVPWAPREPWQEPRILGTTGLYKIGDTVITNFKEVEFVPNTNLFFAEVGGKELPSRIAYGFAVTSNEGAMAIAWDILEEWLAPGIRPYMETHVSPGPIVVLDYHAKRYGMFVNGRRSRPASEGSNNMGEWSVGWLEFQVTRDGFPCLKYLSNEPVIKAPPDAQSTYSSQVIRFASSTLNSRIFVHDDGGKILEGRFRL
jgi:hypothetical protein